MALHHRVTRNPAGFGSGGNALGSLRRRSGRLVHLLGMTPLNNSHDSLAAAPSADLEPFWTLAELADGLHVTRQTLYDLRSQGRGPKGFRVGRQLRFRASEVEAWLANMEADDARRHPVARR